MKKEDKVKVTKFQLFLITGALCLFMLFSSFYLYYNYLYISPSLLLDFKVLTGKVNIIIVLTQIHVAIHAAIY